jgi:glycosyltransferase involved in cell wall biosynthesis
LPGHVLQVITDTDRRGAQVFAIDLQGAFERAGVEVRTVALAPGSVGGLDVPVLGARRVSRRSLAALRAEMRTARVVAAHGSTTLPACAIASIGLRTSFVYRQISDSLFWAPDRLRRLRVRVALSRAAAVVALWQGSAQTLTRHFGVASSKLHVIPNGVPADRFAPVDEATRAARRAAFGLDERAPTVLSLGALVPEKGVDLAIEAVAALSDVQLLVAGDGPERRSLEGLGRERAAGRVQFAGSLTDPRPAYEAADLIVLPSRGGDSMPAVLIEAALTGVPAVATPVEGIPEIVVPGSTGELVAIGDSAALAAAIRRMLDDRARLGRIAEDARRRALARFGIDVVAKQWAEVLDKVM